MVSCLPVGSVSLVTVLFRGEEHLIDQAPVNAQVNGESTAGQEAEALSAEEVGLGCVLLLAGLGGSWLGDGGQQTKQACRPSTRNKSGLAVAHAGPLQTSSPLLTAPATRSCGDERTEAQRGLPTAPRPGCGRADPRDTRASLGAGLGPGEPKRGCPQSLCWLGSEVSKDPKELNSHPGRACGEPSALHSTSERPTNPSKSSQQLPLFTTTCPSHISHLRQLPDRLLSSSQVCSQRSSHRDRSFGY